MPNSPKHPSNANIIFVGEEKPEVTSDAKAPSDDDNLRNMEAGLVWGLAILLAALALHVCIWVLTGCGEVVHARVTRVIRAINENWKFDLVLVILLFFRPVRKFLDRMKKGPFGSEIHEGSAPPPPTTGYGTEPRKPNS